MKLGVPGRWLGRSRDNPGQNAAEIEQTQFPVFAQQQVFRLDVAVQDVAPMQHAHRADQPWGDLQ